MNGATKVVATSSAILPLVTAQTVAFERGVGGRISQSRTLGGQRLSRSKSNAKFGTISSSSSSASTSKKLELPGTGKMASSAGYAYARILTANIYDGVCALLGFG
jgi:hypothetical protein